MKLYFGYNEQRRFIRFIKGKTRLDRIRSEKLRRGMVKNSLPENVEKTKFTWFGDVKRKEDMIPRKMEKLVFNRSRPQTWVKVK